MPGESLAKYRGLEGAPSESVETQHAVSPTEDKGQQTRFTRQPQDHVQSSSPEQTDVEERVEHALRQTTSESGERGGESPDQDFGARTISEPPSEDDGSAPHQFGSGVLEEEEMEGEEAEVSPFGQHLDEEIYEELEEETIDAENAEQLVEAVREAHVIQRLGLRDSEPQDADDHPSGEEEAERFLPENGHASSEPLQSAEADLSSDEAQEGEHEGVAETEAEGEDGSEDVSEEGRAELRAPAGTAGFQQRTERTDRAPDRFRRGSRRGRPMRGRRNIQRESQPTISDLLKEGQEILVQIAKEPIAKKGARITSHIALPGRFLVYMPTVNHVGVSRKIGSDEERQRLKRVLISEKGGAHGGFIVRTAAAGASEEDLRSDLRFLINLWNDIKSRAENSKAPALIYHDLNLVERILRDQVTSNFNSIWVDSEQEYERIVRFLGRFQPAMVRRAKLYTKETPLFEQFGIQEEINNALKSKVWLKSGGYIVINQTEALVAIDINTGKYVGKTQRLEDTIVKTNTDAIREIVRQIRLRDLGGIIVIDFIDMDERKNRQKVMQALEEALKSDRAPSKVLQFNDFGLVAITRKRVKQSLERTLSTPCIYCTGTGMIKSVQTVCNEIYVEMRKMSKHLEQRDVMLRVNPEVVKALKAGSGRWLQEMEELTGKTVIVKSDPLLHQEQFDIN
jgi:ribonuclease G